MKYYYKIIFEEGLHSRYAIRLTELCKEYSLLNFEITKINGISKSIRCRNLISILTANISKDDEIEITVSNSDEITNKKIKEKLDEIFLDTLI